MRKDIKTTMYSIVFVQRWWRKSKWLLLSRQRRLEPAVLNEAAWRRFVCRKNFHRMQICKAHLMQQTTYKMVNKVAGVEWGRRNCELINFIRQIVLLQRWWRMTYRQSAYQVMLQASFRLVGSIK